MDIIYLKKAYKAPLTEALEINARGVLCQSKTEGENTEMFTLSGYSYDNDDFE